jgi:hypothetical protein
MFPIVFINVGDVLTQLKVCSLILETKEWRYYIAAISDDAIILSDADPIHLQNLRWTLVWFEQISKIKIHFYNSNSFQ